MLRIIFYQEKWHQHTFGCPVTMYSDHRLLASIMKKPLDKLLNIYGVCEVYMK